jgi:ribonucleoside-diphosphate reductase alpha chain
VPGTGNEVSAKQVIHRIANTIRMAGEAMGYFQAAEDADIFELELSHILINQKGAFNSPVWFNCGLYHHYGISGTGGNWYWDFDSQSLQQTTGAYARPQCSACFIQSIQDDLMSIFDLIKSEARLFKYGSGSGTNFSKLRSKYEKLAGGGTSSGLMTFLTIFDRAAGSMKSGGTTRRAAKMVCLDLEHPEILDFINWKVKEEKKVHALVAAGYPSDFNGEAYLTVAGQNSNNSIRVPDEFMQAYLTGGKWKTRFRTTGEVHKEYEARDMMHQIAQAAWSCADPGVQFDTVINDWHTCPNTDRIKASNPCVTGDTLIATATGYKRMIELVHGEADIINGRGQKSHVTEIFPTGKKPVYLLKTRSGYSLKLTGNHQVMTANRGDVPASLLTKDDIVLLERPGFGTQQLPTALAEALGAAVGDGCISGEQEHLFITLGKTEGAVAERINSGINEFKIDFAVESSAPDLRASRQNQVIQTATTLRVGTSARPVVELLKQYAVLNMGSQQKQFTDNIYLLDRQSQASVLRALFTTDGTVADYGEKSQYVSLDSCSIELLKQTQLLLLGFGIKSKLYENRRAGGSTAILPDGKGGTKEYPVCQMHSLRISRSSRIVFQQEIGFLQESAKSEKLAMMNKRVGTYNDSLTDAVDSLTYLGEEEVYDLTEPETSHFVANGIVVHNCSEYMFLDDSSCNLSSVNLMKFLNEDGTFDIEGYRAACRILLIAQEIFVDFASYPTREIAKNTHDYRALGLGYANLGTLLMVMGVPYDSDKGRAIAGSITSIMTGKAYSVSAEMAAVKGTFPGFKNNREPMLRVMRKHRDAAYKIDVRHCPAELLKAARDDWDNAVELGEKYGYRNAQVTVLAPTGTIGLLMDCDTTGVEPDFSLVKYKKLAGGGYFKIINQSVPRALRKLGYNEEQVKEIQNYVLESGTMEGAPHIKDEHLAVFDCANKCGKGKRFIDPMGHIKMMAAVQPFLSGSLSKTVNLPNETTVEEIEKIYIDSWKMGLKAVAVYRDGCKMSQPLTAGSKLTSEKKEQAVETKSLPSKRTGRVVDSIVGGNRVVIRTGEFSDGSLGEVSIDMHKEGSTMGSMMSVIAQAVSIGLQHGVPLEQFVEAFTFTKFEPSGMTTHPNIKTSTSIVDFVFRVLGFEYLGRNDLVHVKPVEQAQQTPAPKQEPASMKLPAQSAPSALNAPPKKATSALSQQLSNMMGDAPPCPSCGNITIRSGTCYKCLNCGSTTGCS